ncbi:hypothetical protein E1200_30465 [Actinomadura sp. GC306]|uniref:hypothetical protein n=1 Tax=Actinomadura sp. GC306 TaxID=2530367 RepID=UPI0010509C61|nr:hypothetical protein [Actinomadura sp. GC306]TDC60435.1 hypothetical protein E1200_30465 [Actinomadura sp. GC306]
MSGKKLNPVFVVLCVAGALLIGFSLFGTLVAGARLDEADEDKSEVSLQLATMLNFIVAGLALILAGVGFQLTSGPKTPPPPLPGQAPGYPHGQAQQQYQAQPQQAPQSQGGQQWGQQH